MNFQKYCHFNKNQDIYNALIYYIFSFSAGHCKAPLCNLQRMSIIQNAVKVTFVN